MQIVYTPQTQYGRATFTGPSICYSVFWYCLGMLPFLWGLSCLDGHPQRSCIPTFVQRGTQPGMANTTARATPQCDNGKHPGAQLEM